MKKINIDTLSKQTQDLIDEVEQLTKSKIIIETDTETTTDYLDLSQSEHRVDNDEVIISINNSPRIEYMIAHELFHIKLDYSEFTDMKVELFGSDAGFNQQSQITASSLKGIVDHRMIAFWEEESGVRTADIKSLLHEGTAEMLAAEGMTVDDDQLTLYRTLVMLDDFTNTDGFDKYEQPYRIAGKLDATIQKVTNKEQHYSALVRLFSEFDENIKLIGYIDLMHKQLITLTPIISSRQLRLTVNQVVNIIHSEFVNRSNEQPYVIEMKNSQQNSGVLNLVSKRQTPEFFKTLYQMQLSEFLKEYQIDYIIR